MNRKKLIARWILQNISENQTFQITKMFIMDGFLRNGLHERCCLVVEVDKMYS